MRTFRRLVLVVVVAHAPLLVACDPVKMPHEVPGPVGCGKRDPRAAGPSMLSVAQQQTYKSQGTPGDVVDNDQGGKTWLYLRQNGSVFGEQVVEDAFVFNLEGLLVQQKSQIHKYVGK